ncbi:MAG TPA: hypothetical protein VE992_03975 [Solirubrobacteraceae bacterium]|nr:hypothetical protein [Solirubrobacteraceae bacterium]
MGPLSVELRLLSELRGPALRLTAGRALMARVMAADGSGRGMLNIAGAVLEAELPRQVKAGEQLRLVVRHVDEQRVVLELPQGQPNAPVPPPALALPGGGQLRVVPDEEAPAGPSDAVHRLALDYEAPALGTLELRFELDAGALRVSVAAPPGQALELTGERAGELRSVLARTGERAVSVTVRPRREPLDVYA